MSWKYHRPVTISPASACDVILSPVITEKATMGSEHNQVTFRVPLDASKPAIRAAVEHLFKVKVKAVTIRNVHTDLLRGAGSRGGSTERGGSSHSSRQSDTGRHAATAQNSRAGTYRARR